MHAPREHRHRRVARAPEQEFAGVADDGGGLRPRDLAVRDLGLDVDGVDDVAEPRAEDHADARLQLRA